MNIVGNVLEEGIEISPVFIDYISKAGFKLNLKTGDYGYNPSSNKRKYNIDIIKQLHELYSNGYLFVADLYHLFMLSTPARFHEALKYCDLNPLSTERFRELYGDIISRKTRETSIKKYGVDNPSKSPEIRAKIVDTTIKKYGVDNPSKSPEIKQKIKHTLTHKYSGIGNAVDIIKHKYRNTMIARHGVSHNWQHGALRENIQNTMIVRYGATHNWQKGPLRDKLESKWLDTYGTTNPMKCKRVSDRMQTTKDLKIGYPSRRVYMIDDIPEEQRELFIIQNFSSSRALQILKQRGYRESKKFTEETIMRNILDDLGVNYIYNAKSAHGIRNADGNLMELDFLIKVTYNYSVAVEVNGVAFHSSNMAIWDDPKPKEYHCDKRVRCQQHGIKLLGFMDFDIQDFSKHQWIKDEIVRAIENPWSEEKIEQMKQSTIAQYKLTKYTYKNWEYWDYGTFIR